MSQQRALPCTKQIPNGLDPAVRVSPWVVSLAREASKVVAILLRSAPSLITGDPDCGDPLAFNIGVILCTAWASCPEADFQAVNDPVNDPFQIKQLFMFPQDGP
jgi:hypothetical protein